MQSCVGDNVADFFGAANHSTHCRWNEFSRPKIKIECRGLSDGSQTQTKDSVVIVLIATSVGKCVCGSWLFGSISHIAPIVGFIHPPNLVDAVSRAI